MRSNIEPDVFNAHLFFTGKLGRLPLLDELEKFAVTKSVDVRGFSSHFLGVLIDSNWNIGGYSASETLGKMSMMERISLFESMKREYVEAYKRRGIPYWKLVYDYGFDHVSTLRLYNSLDVGVLIERGGRIRVDFDGWEFPFAIARHALIVGQSRSGKSVTLAKCAKICSDNGWTIVDINDSNGRMETGACVFSLYDKKFASILKTRWKEANVDSRESAQRMINDIDRLKEVVSHFSDGNREGAASVIYYHPLVDTIPPQLPDFENFRIEFFVFSVADLLEMVGSQNYRRIFEVFGEALNAGEELFLFYIRKYLISENKLEIASLADVMKAMTELHSSKEVVTINNNDGTSAQVDFSERSVMTLVRKLDKLNSVKIFQPEMVEIDGVRCRNPILFDVKKIVERKGVYNCITTKWASPDLKYVVVSYFLDKLVELKRRSEIRANVALLCRELYELAPPKPSGLELLTFNSLKRICAGGADLGIRLIADSQQFMQVSREIKRNIHCFIIHRIVDSADKDDLGSSLSRQYFPREYKDLVSFLGVGECIVIYGNQASICKTIPVPFMSKIEGTDTFSMLMAYSDNRISSAELISRRDAFKVCADFGVSDMGLKFVYPPILKKSGVTIDSVKYMQVLAGVAMVCRKKNVATLREVVGSCGLLFKAVEDKYERVSPELVLKALIEDKKSPLRKVVVVNGDNITLDYAFFGYDDIKSLANELFIESVVAFGLEAGRFI